MLHTTSDSTLSTARRRQSRRWKPSLALAMLAALTTFGAATAQAKTSHHYTSVIQSAPVSTAGGYPGVGGTAVLAANWSSSLSGNGALVDHVTITGHPTPTTFTIQVTEVAFLAHGTFKDTATGTDTVNPDGSQSIVLRGRVTGGTDAYRGARGSFTFTGSTAPGSNVISGRSAGTVTY